MTKAEKVKIIKWFIKEKCGLGSIQTKAKEINELKNLEDLVMGDREYPHFSDCDTCWHFENDGKRCETCNERCNYTFPYGYWKKWWEKSVD